MQLQTATRKRAKIKMALQGPSGSGKTFSSIEIAKGICGDYSKVAIVDTECCSSNLYAHLGQYNVMELCLPHSPERYIQAIESCEKAGMEVIILDSVTPEWEYLLDYHASLHGNSFTNWSKVTPRNNAFIQKILSSPCHIICTVRTKTDYVMNEKNGKMVPEKVGLKSIQKETFDFEMTLVLDLDSKNNAVASKDRTGLFTGKPEFKISVQTGAIIRDWCLLGSDNTSDEVLNRIVECRSIQDLLTVYKDHPAFQESLKPEFEKRKRELIISAPSDETKHLSTTKTYTNGRA